jgi:hypothetical protein
LPAIRIKEKYLSKIHDPNATGDSGARKTWPYHRDVVTLIDYHESLAQAMYISEYQQAKLHMGVGRMLGFLEVDGATIDSVEVLLALYASGKHKTLMSSPLLHHQHHWTYDIVDGLQVYCQYHIHKLRKQFAYGDQYDVALKDVYTFALNGLLSDVKYAFRQQQSLDDEMGTRARPRSRSPRHSSASAAS